MFLTSVVMWLTPVWLLSALVAADALVAPALHHKPPGLQSAAAKSPYRRRHAHQRRRPSCSSLRSAGTETQGDAEGETSAGGTSDGGPDSSKSTAAADDATNVPRGGAINVSKRPPPPLPTMADYRKFALPCLGLWVSQPLLSLVDTAFVGLSGLPSQSASNLAALGPATTFFDGATYLFAFLNVATTNLYSSALAQRGEQSDQAEGVVRTASRIALRCGFGIMLFLLAFARPLLALYIGKQE